MTSQADKGKHFRYLHERSGTFIIPNPWDAGSARMLEAMGFEALATTSSGFANSLGRLDGEVTLFEKLAHCRSLCDVTSIPVSADFENGFADDPETVATNILLLAETGVAGCSIEDFGDGHIYEFMLAVERVEAAVETVRSLPFDFVLTARAENLLHGVDDLGDTIKRLQAFEAAGADVLYAPGLATLEQVRTVVDAVERPVNVLCAVMPDVTLAQYEEAGVRRVSLGGAVARFAMTATAAAGREMHDQGSFGFIKDLMPNREIVNAFRRQ
jgi:2-methylisocitrate lyase-like PEP mutase family enzyme